MLNFDRSTVKHALQNTPKSLSDSSRVHQIRFLPGLCPGPRWESLQRSPDPLAGLRGPTSTRRRKRGEGRVREEREGEGRETVGEGGRDREGEGKGRRGEGRERREGK